MMALTIFGSLPAQLTSILFRVKSCDLCLPYLEKLKGVDLCPWHFVCRLTFSPLLLFLNPGFPKND